MNQFGVHNEAEIVSGCISKFAKHRRKKGDVKTMIIDAVHALRKKLLRLVHLHRCLPSANGMLSHRVSCSARGLQIFAIINRRNNRGIKGFLCCRPAGKKIRLFFAVIWRYYITWSAVFTRLELLPADVLAHHLDLPRQGPVHFTLVAHAALV